MRRLLELHAEALAEIDLALVMRDRPQCGTLLLHEPLVWVGIAVLTSCRVPALERVAVRSKASQRSATMETLHEQVLRTLGLGMPLRLRPRARDRMSGVARSNPALPWACMGERRMRVVMFARALLSTCLFLGAAVVLAAEEEAVMSFKLPPAPGVQGKASQCNQSLDIPRLLTDDRLLTALMGGDPRVTQVLGSVPAMQKKIDRFGGRADGLVVNRFGDGLVQCQSGCLVLPQGARIKEIRKSDRKGAKGLVTLPGEPDPNDPDPRFRGMRQFSGSRGAVIFGDLSGYRNSQVSRNQRAVCVTAMNLSRVEPTSQVVRVVFER